MNHDNHQLCACAHHVPTLCLCCTQSSVQKFFPVEVVFITIVPCSSCCVCPLLESFCFPIVMPHPSCSTNNSLLAGFPTKDSLLSTATSESPVTSTVSSSWSPQLADSLPKAVVRAIGKLHSCHHLMNPEQSLLTRFFFSSGRSSPWVSRNWHLRVKMSEVWPEETLLRDPSLQLVMVALLLGNSCHPQFSLPCTQLVISAPIQAIASVLGQRLRPLPWGFRTIWTRPQAGGLVMPTMYIFALHLAPGSTCPDGWLHSRYLHCLWGCHGVASGLGPRGLGLCSPEPPWLLWVSYLDVPLAWVMAGLRVAGW